MTTVTALPRPPLPRPASWAAHARVVGASVVREVIGQPPAKLLNLAAFCAAAGAVASGDETLVTGLVISATAAAGALVAARVVGSHFGVETTAGKAAVALSAAAGGTLGAAFAAGNAAAVAGVESATAVGAVSLTVATLVAHHLRKEVPEWINVAAVFTSIAAGVVVWSAIGMTMPRELSATRLGGVEDGFLIARGGGSLIEALSVELGKELLGGFGPTVDRKGLTFDDRVKASAKILLPYVAACVLINGMVAPSLLENGDGVDQQPAFNELILSVLVTCLTNMLRNGMSAASVLDTWADGRREGVPENPHEHQADSKTFLQRARSVGDRWAIRSILMAARTTTYVFMRMNGYSIATSAMVSQAKYAAFNGFRENLADGMNGEGPSREVLARLIAADPPSRIDLNDVEAAFDPVEVDATFDPAPVEIALRRDFEKLMAASLE